MIVPQPSKSSMNISSDSQTPGVDQHVAELNNNNFMRVRRPNEDQVLAFLDYEVAPEYKPDQQVHTHPLSNRDNQSYKSRTSKQQLDSFRQDKQDDVSPLKQNSHQELLLIDSPVQENEEIKKLSEYDSKRKGKSNQSAYSPSKSPKRKSRFLSKIISKFKGEDFIKKFIKKIKQLYPYGKKATLKQNQLIQDLASDCTQSKPIQQLNTTILYEKISKNNKFVPRQLTQNVKTSLNNYCTREGLLLGIRNLSIMTINPQGNFLFIWEFCKFLITLATLFTLSIQLCFSLDVLNWFFITDRNDSQFGFIFVCLYYIIDIILGFKTGYYKDGEIVTKSNRIAKRYLKRFFLLDFIAVLPLLINIISLAYLEQDTSVLKVLNCLSFVRSNAVSRIYNSLEVRLLSHPRFVIGYRFLSVIGTVFLYAHVTGCLWYIMGTSSKDNNWLIKAGIQDEPWYALYSYSIYWSVMTMTSVGYGDITPNNYYEALFCVVTMFIASIIFAYSLNTIGLILEDMNRHEQKINENMAIINSYMRRKNIDQSLQLKVRKYLQNIWRIENKFRFNEENRIIKALNLNLQEQIQISIYGKFITSIPFIYKNFSQEFLVQLTKNIEELRVPTNSYLIEASSYQEFGLYQLINGDADQLIDMPEKKYYFGKVKKGEIFGQSSFFYNNLHPYSVKAITECTFAFLSKEAFLYVLRQYPHDYQKYCMLVDKQTFQNKQIFDTALKCVGCNELEHDIDQCNRLHFILNKTIIISKHLHTQENKRDSYSRNSRRTTNARFGQRLFEDDASRYQENNFTFSSVEQSQSQEDIDNTYKHGNSHQERTSLSQKQQTQTSKNVRFRKRSRSLNSLSLHSGDDDSHFQKSMSNYKSQDSKQSDKQSDKLSAIISKNPAASSQLSQSSFNAFLKEASKRKLSRQQDSDRYSSHSNNQPKGHQKQSSQQSSSSNIPHSSLQNQQILQGNQSPQMLIEQKNHHHEDSIYVAQERKRKSLIGTPSNKDTSRHKLQVVREVIDTNQEDSFFSREASLNRSLHQTRTFRTFRTESVKKREDSKQQYKTDTYRQFQENSNSPNNRSSNFDLDFEIPCKLQAYFPLNNRDRVIEKYNTFQTRRVLMIHKI